MQKNIRKNEIKIRLTDDEFLLLREKCGGRIFAKWCRERLLDLPTDSPRKNLSKPPRAVDPDLLKALNRIGVNINQIAKAINSYNEFGFISSISPVEFLRFLTLLESISEEIKEIRNADKTTQK